MLENERIVFLKSSQMVLGKKMFIFILALFVSIIIASCTSAVLMLEAKEAQIFILEKTQVSMTNDIMKYEQECE